ncbi:caspase family protein [Bradyrhizobium prioriisuperbiae]|uniref:caspase family protein n=1 Tax=Bradyrhizobium prioriisuperbiae TaxID=2854389 RepID=UPI0038995E5D
MGNGAYAKSPLATAANDAGLIAQTLQAAGFDVVGARDLDGDSLRKSFRDFVQKAEASGPGTVAMVYLAGYGLQLAGENYFIPVDSTLNRDTDIPIEGLRISDYIRQLAALPLKSSIVVLDAARQQPFIEGGLPIASGLALVEPETNMLIAYNAAPGTIAPVEQGSYGVYAQSLAEMIRTGGLPLTELFNRLRLRVNEASKGAQVPWDAQKLSVPFMFFDRAPDAPAPAAPDQAAAMRDKPIRELGAQDAYIAALDRDTLQGYEDFLGAYGGDPLAKRVRAIVAARREAITWRRTYRADTPESYWSYLRRYPRGPHAADARRRLAILTAPLEPPPSFAMIDYDVPPPPQDEIIYVDRPVLMFNDPDFDFAPPPPPPVFFLPPPPPDFVVLEPPPEPEGLFILPQPYFVPIPVYVRPPIYVRPPQNNFIFNNIHNTTIINTVINRPPQPAPGPGGPIVGPKGGFGGAGPKGGVGPNAGPGGAKGPPGGGFQPQPGAAGPSLPPAVAQRAALINQGKLPVPPSAAINPRQRPGAPGFQPPQPTSGGSPGSPPSVRPNGFPGQSFPGQQPMQTPNQGLPKANVLPMPGAPGAPPAPPSAGFQGRPPGAVHIPTPGQGPGSAPIVVNPPRPAAPGGVPPAGAPPRLGAPPPPLPSAVPNAPHRPGVLPPPAAGFTPPRPAPQAAPQPQIRQQIQRPVPPPRIAPAPRPAPPTRVAPPPRPAPVARPAPPPRMAPPPPRMAPPPPRPVPPPMARPAPPPRMAPPPLRAAPPPPRPAPPAAAKKCPPNVPRC